MEDIRLNFTEALIGQLTDMLMVARLDVNGTAIGGGYYSVADLKALIDTFQIEYATLSAFPTIGESNKIYVALSINKLYRWDGTQYVIISGGLSIGEIADTAYDGAKGKANADNILAMLAGATIDTNTFKEIVDLINSVDLTNDDALAAVVIQLNNAIALKADQTTTYTKSENDVITNGIVDAQAIVNDLKADRATTSVSVTASKTLGLTDVSTLQICNSASLITVTIPTNAVTAFPIGSEIVVVRYGTGAVTITSTATINSSDSLKSINGQYEAVTLKQIATDEWLLIGALSA